MSTVQSHLPTAQPPFILSSDHRNLMNVPRQDILRQSIGLSQPGMFPVYPQPQAQQQPQHPQHPQQQMQPHMALLQNNPASNLPVGILPTNANNPGGNPGPASMYSHLQPQNARGRLMMPTQQQPPFNSSLGQQPPVAGVTPSAHFNGIPHNQLSAMPFPNGLNMTHANNAQVRRVPTQNQPPGNQLGGMHGNQQAPAGVLPGMQVNQSAGIPTQQRHPSMHQQQMNTRMPTQMQHQQQQQQPNAQIGMQNLPAEIAMAYNTSQMAGAVNPNAMPRSTPAPPPILGSLPQPSMMRQAHQPGPGGMQPPPPPQNAFQNANHALPPSHAGSPPRSGSLSKPHTPALNMPPQQNPNPDRPQSRTDNAMMMGFQQNQQFSAGLAGHGRLPNSQSGPQFSFNPGAPPTPGSQPNMMPNMTGVSNANIGRNVFPLTPAQQLQRGNEASFMQNVASQTPLPPPRPPSQQRDQPSMSPRLPPNVAPYQSPQTPRHQPSPRPQSTIDHHTGQLPQQQQQHQIPHPRPSSQPVAPSQSGPSRTTPRPQQSPLPNAQPLSRVSSGLATPHQTHAHLAQPPNPQQQQHAQIGPMQPKTPGIHGSAPPMGQLVATPPIAAAAPPGAPGPNHHPPGPTQAMPDANGPMRVQPIFQQGGQGMTRLLQFSHVLSSENKNRLQLSFWNRLVQDYFTQKASMKVILWKVGGDPKEETGAKPFDIGVPILPQFFLVTSRSGVKSMSLSLDGARERVVALGQSYVECHQAVWTFKYNNGYIVALKGVLTAHVMFVASPANPNLPPQQQQPTYSLKFDMLSFEASAHEKSIVLDAIAGSRVPGSKSPRMRQPTTPNSTPNMSGSAREDRSQDICIYIDKAIIPMEPVNAFGVPQATMRCLELAESIEQMSDLMEYSKANNNLSPQEALSKYAQQLREKAGAGYPSDPNFAPGVNGIPPSPAVTLYTGSTAGSEQPTSVMNTPQTNNAAPPPHLMQNNLAGPSDMSSPQLAPANAHTPPAPPLSAGPSTSSHSTPLLANAALKRKATNNNEASSPTTTSGDQPPAKRPARKRGRG